MFSVRVEIKGDKRAIAQLRKMIHEFDDWKKELTAVGEYLVKYYQDPVFETEGGIFGARWAALSPAYAIKKATTYPGRGILEAKGDLRKAYGKRVFANLLEIFNKDPKASYHQDGTRRMPPRLLIRVDNKQRDEIVDIFKKGVLIKVEKAIKSA
jgi:hypothetical protein